MSPAEVLARDRRTVYRQSNTTVKLSHTCCNRTVAGQEWLDDDVKSLLDGGLSYWTLLCSERFQLDLEHQRRATVSVSFLCPSMVLVQNCVDMECTMTVTHVIRIVNCRSR